MSIVVFREAEWTAEETMPEAAALDAQNSLCARSREWIGCCSLKRGVVQREGKDCFQDKDEEDSSAT